VFLAACAVGMLIPAARAEGGRLKIIALGDSTTKERAPQVKQVYAQTLAQELPRRGVDAEVINAGVPGNNTEDAGKRLEHDVLAQKPDLVIVQFGINDAAADVWRTPPQTQPRISREVYEQNLRAMVKKIRAGGAKLILMTPNPTRWSDITRKYYAKPPYKPDDPDGLNVFLRDYAEAARRVARDEKVPLVDVYAAFEEHGKKPGATVDELLLDGMHPNDAGQKLVADLLIEKITAPHFGLRR
jgi:lysophospholipase L1-like esterase